MPSREASTSRWLCLAGSEETEAIGMRLARTRPDTGVIHLHGELGAGKSTLARACLRALGVTGAIKSPTYTLVERYPLADGREAVHLDLYRIGQADELDFLGLDDLSASASLWLVEWPERGGGRLPVPDLVLELRHDGARRRLRFRAEGRVGRDWLLRLGDLEPWREPAGGELPNPGASLDGPSSEREGEGR